MDSERERVQRNHFLYSEEHKKYKKKQHLNAIYYYSIGKKLLTRCFKAG